MFVKNSERLLDHGHIELRRAALDVVEHGLCAADPYGAVKEAVHLDGHWLTAGNLSYDLNVRGAIFVLGAGKATLRIAEALEEILGPRISAGLISIKRGQPHDLRHIRVIEAGHPIPDGASFQAAREMLALAKRAKAGDIVFTAFTGGSSALLCYPAEGMTLDEKREVHQLLLFCGADILQINAVRKHLSRVKGGLLAQAALPAELINLTVSDVIEDPPDYICCPVVPDTSSLDDAIDVLKRNDLWTRVAPSVRAHLSLGPDAETPKSLDPRLVHTWVIVPIAAASTAAVARARELGYAPLFLTTCLTGESREAGAFLGAIAREIARRGRPLAPPCALILNGENTVTVAASKGTGGPSQELAASLALYLDGLPCVVAACLDTDGTDGPTDYAGALVDSQTASVARAGGHDLFRALRAHDVAPLLQDVGDIVCTGATGTNVADLVVILIGQRDACS